MKTIKINTSENGDSFLHLSDFADFVDTEKVCKYTLEEVEDLDRNAIGLLLKFFDEDGKIVPTNEKG